MFVDLLSLSRASLQRRIDRDCTLICLSEGIFRAVLPTLDTDTSLFLFIAFFLNIFIFLLYFCDSLRVVYPDIKPIFQQPLQGFLAVLFRLAGFLDCFVLRGKVFAFQGVDDVLSPLRTFREGFVNLFLILEAAGLESCFIIMFVKFGALQEASFT